MGYVMVIATPIFAQLMLKSLLSLAIDLSRAIIQFGRGGIVSLWVDYHQSIQQLYLTNRRGEMWQNRCCFVILCGCYHGFNFPSFCRLTALLCLISFLFFYRQVTCNWLERERERERGEENKWKGSRGEENERERAGPERFLVNNGSLLLCWLLI